MPSLSSHANLRLITTLAHDWVGRLADLVYPPTCPGCGIHTGSHAGFCPACWGAIRFIERPFCEVLGVPFSYDPGPGMLSAQAIADPPVFDRLRSAVIYEASARKLVHGLKYKDRTDLASMMAGWMARIGQAELSACDGIIPVPLHPTRLALRKFNQAAELGRHLALLSNSAFLPATLIRIKRTGETG
jgi:predicted amidophosphoribosyltransferase